MRNFRFNFLILCLTVIGGVPFADEVTSAVTVFDLTHAELVAGTTAYPNTGLAVREKNGVTDFLIGWRNYHLKSTYIQRVRLDPSISHVPFPLGEPLNVAQSESFSWTFNGSYAAAYNAIDDEYLVVWRGAFAKEGNLPSQDGLFYRRINAVSLEPVSEIRQLAGPSSMLPVVEWISESNHYVIAWTRYNYGKMSVETRALTNFGEPLTQVTFVDRTDGKTSNEECEMFVSLVQHSGGIYAAFPNANGGTGSGAQGIVLRELDTLGVPSTERIMIPRLAEYGEEFMCNPSLLSLGETGVLVYWRGYGWSGSNGWPIRSALVTSSSTGFEVDETFYGALNGSALRPFGVIARASADGATTLWWMDKSHSDVLSLPPGVSGYSIWSADMTRDAESTHPEKIAEFTTASPASLYIDGRAPFLLSSNSMLANWFEVPAYGMDGFTALRGMYFDVGVPSPNDGAYQLKIYDLRVLPSGVVQFYLSNEAEVPTGDLWLHGVFSTSDAGADIQFKIGNCDILDGECLVASIDPGEQRKITLVPIGKNSGQATLLLGFYDAAGMTAPPVIELEVVLAVDVGEELGSDDSSVNNDSDPKPTSAGSEVASLPEETESSTGGGPLSPFLAMVLGIMIIGRRFRCSRSQAARSRG